MTLRLRRELDPLDLEAMERPLDAALVAVKGDGSVLDLDSDEALEAALCQELIEIAYENDVSGPELLRERLFAALAD